MRTVGLGIQEFEKIRKNNQFYIDKTDFIREWYQKNDDITLITRPRRFGKTLTIDMLYCFFSPLFAGRSDLFKNLAVSQSEEMMKLQGMIPSIKVSFSGIKANTFYGFLLELSGKIGQTIRIHSYLLKDVNFSAQDREIFERMSRLIPQIPDPQKSETEYKTFLYQMVHSLQILSHWLYCYYGKKAYIFLDEYDTPVQTAYQHHYYQEAISVLRELFSETLKENPYLDRAVLTGITRIAKESMFSDRNNIEVCSVVSGGYNCSFGFTKDEMKEILDEYGLTEKQELVRFWYDGFTIGKETEIYNPWSVTNYLAKRDRPPEAYWAQSGGVGLVDRLIRKQDAALQDSLQELLQGGEVDAKISEDLVFPSLNADSRSIWTLLTAAGYLKPVYHNGEQDALTLTNHESLLCFTEMVRQWFVDNSEDYMEKFAKALLSDDLEEMNWQMTEIVHLCISVFDTGNKSSRKNPQPENFFHGLATGLLTCLLGRFALSSNRESGYGRYDLCLEPLDKTKHPFAYILEFKVFSVKDHDHNLEDTAIRARKQIDDKRYDSGLLAKGYLSEEIRKYGIGFRGKDVRLVG